MMTELQKQAIRDLKLDSWSNARIAARLGLDEACVRMYCHRNLKAPQPKVPTCRNCGGEVVQNKGKRKLFCCDRCRYDWHNGQRSVSKNGR